MGYTVVTLANEEVITWLQSMGIAVPSNWRLSRYPTPNEIRAVLNAIDGYTIDYFVSDRHWQVTIAEKAQPETGALASPVVLGFEGDEAKPLHFYFETGWHDLMIDVLNKLSNVCGPLALINPSDTTDVVVAPTLK
jgi:hypothetical protein